MLLRPRVFDVHMVIDCALDVPFDDWPDQVKDHLEKAIETFGQKKGVRLRLESAEYYVEHAYTKDEQGYHNIRAVARESVLLQ